MPGQAYTHEGVAGWLTKWVKQLSHHCCSQNLFSSQAICYVSTCLYCYCHYQIGKSWYKASLKKKSSFFWVFSPNTKSCLQLWKIKLTWRVLFGGPHVPSFVRSLVGWLVGSFVCMFVRSFVRSFIRSLVCSFVRFFLRLFVYPSVRSLPHSFLSTNFLKNLFSHTVVANETNTIHVNCRFVESKPLEQ